jgi:peptidoglycan/LPS O-acetylase OafA/YrhL
LQATDRRFTYSMNTAFTVASALAGALLFYSSTSNQRWLREPWPARPARIAAAVCVIASLVSAAIGLQISTSLSVVITTLMACLTAYPFIGVLVERTQKRMQKRMRMR